MHPKSSEKRKAAVLAACACLCALLLSTVLPFAARHHVPAMYLIVPLIFAASFAMVHLLAIVVKLRHRQVG